MPLPLLLTRPRAASDRVAARFKGDAARVVVSPLLRIELRGVPEVTGGVLLTSRHAVAAWQAADGPAGLPAWVVGPATAEAARAAGFDVRDVAPTAVALAEMVPLDAPPLVHLRGEVQRGDLAAALRERGITANDCVVYDQVAHHLTDEALALLRSGSVVVPLYSPRSATIFGDECPQAILGNVRAVCLSDAVAEACPVTPVLIANRPDGAAMDQVIRSALAAIGG